MGIGVSKKGSPIHKNLTEPPGRPIVSGIESVSSRVSEYIDRLLQPYVIKSESHLKDTINILQELEKVKWEANFILVTSDVGSLYSNIPHEDGNAAVKHILEKAQELLPEQIEYVLEGIDLILKNNYFWYDNDFYLQTKGNAMGTKFAPNFANLFMSCWEEPLIQKGGGNIILYKRFVKMGVNLRTAPVL